MTEFSNRNRSLKLKESSEVLHDLIIIGGGISGAGIALDASLRSLKVLLLEKADFASGTSSKSTKLIHGGLRYLKQWHFNQVREAVKERHILSNNVPHLIVPMDLLIPIYRNASISKRLLWLGLNLYETLGKVNPANRHNFFNSTEGLQLEPLLNKNFLTGGAVYKEYQTHDARLTIETLKEAVVNGADAFNYLECTKIRKESEEYKVVCKDRLNDSEVVLRSKCVVNAAGPWIEDVLQLSGAEPSKKLVLSKGIHLVFRFSELPVSKAVYFETNDKRMVFAIPFGEYTYLGTTDTFYYKSKDYIEVEKEEILYLLTCANEAFPSVNLQLSSVQSFWAGLRPLIKEDGKSAGDVSRRDEIFISPDGIISIAGGKLTGFRKMAEKTVDALINNKFIPGNTPSSSTKTYKYRSGPDQGYFSELREAYKDQPEKEILRLIGTYGRSANEILDYQRKKNSSIILAELWYGTNYEMVTLPSDFIFRRTNYGHFSENRSALYDVCEQFIDCQNSAETLLLLHDKAQFQKFIRFISDIQSNIL